MFVFEVVELGCERDADLVGYDERERVNVGRSVVGIGTLKIARRYRRGERGR